VCDPNKIGNSDIIVPYNDNDELEWVVEPEVIEVKPEQ